MRPPVAALAPMAGALAWVAALLIDPNPLPQVPSALLVGTGLLVMATVSTTGLVVLGAHWAHRLGWVVLGLGLALAVIRPIDAAWVVALSVTALAAVALAIVERQLRKLPSADGPPVRAMMLALVLIGVPTALGLSRSGPSWAVLAVGFGALLAAFLYARVVFGGLVTARIIWPAGALSMAPLLEPAGMVVALVLAAVVLALAWHPSTKAAYHPPHTVGSTFPIPPELTPSEILDAAGIDDRGRRKS